MALVLHMAAACHPSSCLHERQLGCRDKSKVSREQQRRKCKRLRQPNQLMGAGKRAQGSWARLGEERALEWREARSGLDCLRSSGEDATASLPGAPPPMLAEAVSVSLHLPSLSASISCLLGFFVPQDKDCILFCVHHPTMWGSRAGPARSYYL